MGREQTLTHKRKGMPRSARLVKMLLLLALSGPLPGCAWCRSFFVVNPYGPGAPCQLVADMPLPELVAHLNRTAERVTALRAAQFKIHSRGAGFEPIPLSASLMVETPRNFRLVASSLMGPEVDLGSNSEEFWFWAKRAQKHIFMARHDQIARAQQRFPIPFQPDWLIEAMGVIPLNEAELTYEPGVPGSNRASLVSQRISPQGRPVRKVTVVDTCHGVIVEHVLYDETGRLIASARMSEHYREPLADVVLPARIDLDWPQEQLGLTMTLGRMEVNPSLPLQAWTLPSYPGYPVVDLGR